MVTLYFLGQTDNIALDVAPTYADLDLPLKICARDTIGLSYYKLMLFKVNASQDLTFISTFLLFIIRSTKEGRLLMRSLYTIASMESEKYWASQLLPQTVIEKVIKLGGCNTSI